MNRLRPNIRDRRTFVHLPAVHAASIQLLSFLLVLGFAYGIARLTEIHLTIPAAALLQGAIAAVASRWRGLPVWWTPIQALFPAALVATLALQLPPSIFLVAFVILVGLYWSTFRTRVPFYPSGPDAWSMVEALLPQDRPIRFVDIGSGLGGLVLDLSQKRKDSAFVGIEVAPFPWLFSWLRSCLKRSGARFLRGDYQRLDFAAYDVVFAYLSPAAMPELWRKARAEMRSGTLLLSYEFDIQGVQPRFIRAPVNGGPALYGWQM